MEAVNGGLIFRARQRNPGLRSQFAVGLGAVELEGLFQELDIQLFQIRQVVIGPKDIPGAVGVYHDVHIIPQAFPGVAYPGNILLQGQRRLANFHFIALEAHALGQRHFILHAHHAVRILTGQTVVHATAAVCGNHIVVPAPKLVAGQTRNLAYNIPQGDVDAADGVHMNAHAAVLDMHIVHVIPDGLHVQGILADKCGTQFLFQYGHHTGRRAAGIIRLTDAHDASIRHDPYQNAETVVINLIRTG